MDSGIGWGLGRKKRAGKKGGRGEGKEGKEKI